MSAAAKRARSVEQSFGGHGNPFGGFSPGINPVHTVTIPDAVRRCRWIAVDLNAAGFSLFLVDPALERQVLAPCFDSAHPGIAAQTRLIAGNHKSGIVSHVRKSSVPCWWSDEEVAPATFLTLDWCQRIEPLIAGASGMAFPVHFGRKCGLVVFFGPDIALAPHGLFEIHARCFSLFEAVTSLSPAATDDIPSISKRELECLKLTANGYTSDEIARLLKLSVHTANQYLSNTTQKLNAVNRMHAVAKALRLGLID